MSAPHGSRMFLNATLGPAVYLYPCVGWRFCGKSFRRAGRNDRLYYGTRRQYY